MTKGRPAALRTSSIARCRDPGTPGTSPFDDLRRDAEHAAEPPPRPANRAAQTNRTGYHQPGESARHSNNQHPSTSTNHPLDNGPLRWSFGATTPIIASERQPSMARPGGTTPETAITAPPLMIKRPMGSSGRPDPSFDHGPPRCGTGCGAGLGDLWLFGTGGAVGALETAVGRPSGTPYVHGIGQLVVISVPRHVKSGATATSTAILTSRSAYLFA